jgi:hypothetical protein
MDAYLIKTAINAYVDEWEKLASVYTSAGRAVASAKGGSHSPAIQKLINMKGLQALAKARKKPPPLPLKARATVPRKKGLPPPLKAAA